MEREGVFMIEDQKRTQALVSIGIMTALITAVTILIKIPIPQGYLNFGDVVVMISAFVMPFRGALIAAGLGSALADLFGGYPIYAIFTFFIKMAEVAVIYKLSHYLKTKKRIIPFALAGFTMMFLYGLVDGLLVSSVAYIPVSMGYNFFQALISVIIVTMIYPSINELMKHLRGKG